jgi:glucan-binding YG repeat protein
MNKLWNRTAALLMSAAVIASAMPLSVAMAATKEKIDTIYLNVELEETPAKGEDIPGTSGLVGQITASDDRYVVVKSYYTNDDDDEWQYGDTPEIEVRVEINDTSTYAFKSGVKAKVTSNVSTKKVTAKRDGDDEAIITIQLKQIKGDLDAPDDPEWSNNHTASWDEVTSATGYQVKLYRDDKAVTTVDTTNTYYDFAAQITKTGDYYFKVKAKASSSSNNSDWSEESDEQEITSTDLSSISRITPNNTNTTTTTTNSNGTTYTTNYSGTYSGPGSTNPTGTTNTTTSSDGWQSSTNGWYYIYQGKTVTNSWLHDSDGNWYFINRNGYMVTGWYQDYDGNWYYLNPSAGGPMGSMMKGWVQVNSNWYYLNPNQGGPLGSMVTGDITLDGRTYHLDTQTGVLK